MAKKIIKGIVIGLLIIIIVPFAAVYMWSAIIIHKTYNVPLTAIHIPNDTTSIKEGERLTRIAHCAHCHGDKFNGGVVAKVDYVAEFIAPNITNLLPGYTDEELQRLIKDGVKKDGQSVYVMPSIMYHGMKEESVAKIIAYLRTLHPLPSSAGVSASTTYYPLGRLQIIEGKIKSMASTYDHNARGPFDQHDTSEVAFGKYLVMTSCTSCHGINLKGKTGFTPDLIIATAYTKDKFIHLLQTCEGGLGRKTLGMMSDIAKGHLCYLHNNEMCAIYAYLEMVPSQKN
jgi:cytochrome c553